MKYYLYFDDTGNRNPGAHLHKLTPRRDGMDCFGLGGILIKEEDIDELLQKHKQFCYEWKINYPLHSTKIRGCRGEFTWLKYERGEQFLPALQDFLLSLPVVGIACVVDRPGYIARYQDEYPDDLWLMCKTTFCILSERAAKFADENGRNLEVYFEESERNEDRNIIQYMRDLKREGNQFDQRHSGSYSPLTAEEYRRIVLGEPSRRTKKSPQVQIADLVLYPMAKGGYDPDYYPYKKLKEAGKLIDCLVADEDVWVRGIKYSCFGGLQQKRPGKPSLATAPP